ncbi:GTPase activating protein [Rhizoclosmatium sp. JEL0117]|nr:GTPase activating protein [Rhizoclosmatium sp. JEL0117]
MADQVLVHSPPNLNAEREPINVPGSDSSIIPVLTQSIKNAADEDDESDVWGVDVDDGRVVPSVRQFTNWMKDNGFPLHSLSTNQVDFNKGEIINAVNLTSEAEVHWKASTAEFFLSNTKALAVLATALFPVFYAYQTLRMLEAKVDDCLGEEATKYNTTLKKMEQIMSAYSGATVLKRVVYQEEDHRVTDWESYTWENAKATLKEVTRDRQALQQRKSKLEREIGDLERRLELMEHKKPLIGTESDLNMAKKQAYSDWQEWDKREWDYFISYRVASDAVLAKELYFRLRLGSSDGVHPSVPNDRVFLDVEKLKDGNNWTEGFATGLKHSKIVVLIVSEGSLQGVFLHDAKSLPTIMSKFRAKFVEFEASWVDKLHEARKAMFEVGLEGGIMESVVVRNVESSVLLDRFLKHSLPYYHEKWTELTFEGCSFAEPSSRRLLLAALQTNESLTGLKLVKSKIGVSSKSDAFADANDLIALFDEVSKKPDSAMKRMDVFFNAFNRLSSMGKCVELDLSEALILRSNRILFGGAKSIAKGLKKNTSLRRLDLYDSDFGPKGADLLADSLSTHKNLTYLNLEESGIQLSGVWAIRLAIRNRKDFKFLVGKKDDYPDLPYGNDCSSIPELSVSRKLTGDEENIKLFMKCLENFRNVSSLDLSYCKIDENMANSGEIFSGVKHICDGLTVEFFPLLKILKLSGNYFNPETISSLGALLKRVPITSLALERARIDADVFEVLVPFLASNRSLLELHIKGNEIGDGRNLIKLSEQNTSLKLIDVSAQQRKMSRPSTPSNSAQAQDRQAAHIDTLLQMDPLSLAAHETKWRVLERFARVTAYTNTLLSAPIARPLLPFLPPSLHPHNPNNPNNAPNQAFDDGIIDYEPARVYLAKWSHDLQVARSREFVEAAELDAITRTDSFETNTEKDFSFVDEREALSLAASTLGESGRLVMRKNDATSTSSSTKQKKLGVWDETTLAETQIGAFVVLSTDTTPPPPKVSRLPPLSPAEWRLWFDEYVPVPAALPRPRNHLLTTEDSYYIQDEISDSDREDVVDLGVGNGRIVAAQSEIQRRIFVGGVDPELRGQVWPFLFELYPWDSTHAERKKIKAKNTAEYWRMKYEWLAVAERLGHQDFETTPSDQVGQDPDADMYRDAFMRVDKDVPRTDRGHPFYNDPNPPTPRPPGVGPFSPHQNILRDILITYACSYPDSDGIGYVQGQSDLLSPILIICNGDEVDAFYIFAHLMSSKKQNFLTSGTGMHNHLQTISRLLQVTDPIFHSHLSTKLEGGNFFFTFRWFLVSFKREFSFQDTCTLWEVVQTRWAAGGVNDFLYFVALAILDEHRDAIMRYLWTFDELLKYINDLAGVIPINSTLEAAELLYLRFRVRAASLGVLPVLAAEEEPSSARNRGKGKKKKEEMPSVASELGLMEILDLIVAKEAEAREDVKGAGKRKTA